MFKIYIVIIVNKIKMAAKIHLLHLHPYIFHESIIFYRIQQDCVS